MLISVGFYEISIVQKETMFVSWGTYLNIYYMQLKIFVFTVISILSFSIDMYMGNIYTLV